MKTECTKENVMTVLGIGLAKSSFQLHGVNAAGKTLCKQTLIRQKLNNQN